jgi:7-carboxy-7-deazaguanine synthase
VLLETNGAVSVDKVPGDVITIMDLKCPSSGECHRNIFSNLDYLSDPDNVKFVIRDRTDYEWAVNVIDEYGLETLLFILMSPVYGAIDPKQLSEWMLEDKLLARISLQIHKIIWGPEERGR